MTSAFTVNHWDRDVYADYNDEMIAWLQTCLTRTQAGETLKPDPFYPRASLFTPELVRNAIAVMEDKCKFELKHAPNYHLRMHKLDPERGAAGQLRPPGFDALPPAEQLAIVQGMDRIVVKYRALAAEKPPRNPPYAPPTPSDPDMFV